MTVGALQPLRHLRVMDTVIMDMGGTEAPDMALEMHMATPTQIFQLRNMSQGQKRSSSSFIINDNQYYAELLAHPQQSPSTSYSMHVHYKRAKEWY
jgi:hypothetical protein